MADKPNVIVTPPTPEADVSLDDAFSAAFLELTTPVDDGTQVPDVKVKVEAPAAAVADADGLPDPKTINADGTQKTAPGADGTVASADDQGGGDDDGQGTDGQGDDKSKKTGDQRHVVPPAQDDRLLEALNKLIEKQPPVQQQTPTVKEPEGPSYTTEEQTLIETYERDYPEIARAEQLVRREEYKQIVNYVFAQIAPQLEFLAKGQGHVLTTMHQQELQAKVGDYSTIRDDLVKWVDEQPDFLKAAYTGVIKQGTADQVKSMIDQWKVSTGYVDPSAQQQQQEQQQMQQKVPPTPAKKAVSQKMIDALKPVPTKRVNVPTDGVDPDNFDDAFSKFAGAGV